MARDAAGAGAHGWPRPGRLGRIRAAGAVRAWQGDAVCFGATVLAALLAFGALLRVSLERWRYFQTNAYDLAFFDQVIWNSSRGQWFENTFLPYSFAGEHIQPALLAFVPAYWLGAGPVFLLTAQAVVATAAAIPLYWFARRAGLAPILALSGAVAYLANPYMQRAVLFDFHVETMVAFPFFVGAWAVVAERRLLGAGCALSLLLFKEDALFMALALCALMWVQGQRREAVWTAGIALAVTFATVMVVMPYYREGTESGVVDRYGYLLPWRHEGGFVAGLAVAPWRALAQLAEGRVLMTAASFVVVSCLAAVARPWLLVWVVPGLALALLSLHEPQRTLDFHYAAELVPVAAMLAVLGAVRLGGAVDRAVAVGLLAGPALAGMVLLDPVGEARGEPPTREHVAALHAALALVPDEPDVPVSAQSGLLPRLSQRTEAYEFPAGINRAEWFVLDEHGFRSTQSLEAGFEERENQLRSMAELVFEEDGVRVYRVRR